MKCAVGREGVFYEIFQMAADIGRIRMYSGHRRIGRGGLLVRFFNEGGGGVLKKAGCTL